MKRIIAEVPDDLDLSCLAELMANAIAFKIETINNDKPVVRRIHRGERTAVQVIMSHYTPSGVFEGRTAKNWLTKEGFAETTHSGALGRLCDEQYIRPLGAGKFQFEKEMK